MPVLEVGISDLLTIPVVAGLVGWFTNWLAVWMTFHPLEYRGIWRLGWQGIIPSRSERMARIVARRGMNRVGTLREFVDNIDYEPLISQLGQDSRNRIEAAVGNIMQLAAPELWQRIPPGMRLSGQARIHAQLTEQVRNLLQFLRRHICELVDIEEIAVIATRHDPTLVNRIFQRAGEVEFRLIIRAGLWMGLLLGLLISLAWKLYPAWWTLPVGGLLLGLLTNWWALTIIFRPLYPLQVGPFRIQGVFLRRQQQVAAIWGEMIGREVLTLHNILRTVLESASASQAREQLSDFLASQIRERLEADRMLWSGIAPDLDPEQVSILAAEQALRQTLELLQEPGIATKLDPSLSIAIIRTRLAEMDPADFQDVLRPAFQEDEWKLIAIGGALGALAGAIQYLVFTAY